MFAKTTWVRFNVTQDKRDPEEKRLGDELTAACAEMGMYDDDSDGPPPEIFERFCIAVRRCCEYEEGEGERKKYLDQLDSY